MNATGLFFRIGLAALIVVIFAVAVALGWVSRPGLVFYLAAALVGLLVWWDFRLDRAKHEPEDQADGVEPTLPG